MSHVNPNDTAHDASKRQARPGAGSFQISLTLMLLLMVVFATLSAALLYASQVPAIREEIAVLFGVEPSASDDDTGRVAHRAFIMFTFTAPLLLACVLSTIVSVLKFF